MRTYKYSVHGTHNGRSVVVEAVSLKDAVKQYRRTYPAERIKYAAKIQWEAPAFKVGRKSPGQAQDERKAYDDALKEFLA
jgi:hypothetical protein